MTEPFIFAGFVAAVIFWCAWMIWRDTRRGRDADAMSIVEDGIRETVENDYRRSME